LNRGFARMLLAAIVMVMAGTLYAVAAGTASTLAGTFTRGESDRHARAVEFEESSTRWAVTFCPPAHRACAARPMS